MKLESYTKKRDILKSNLIQLRNISNELNLKNKEQEIDDDIKRLESEYFELVVVGEFSRGKSTFINAMLGRRILPSSKKPTTTVISKITYGETPSYCLVYKDGEKKELDEKKFIKLTAPKEVDRSNHDEWVSYLRQKEEIENIDYAVVSYPLNFCKDNVVIIDTPGINDLNTKRVDITYRYLSKSDAVIMVLAANQVLTSSEMDFLKERILNNQISDIFFVINFKDQASEEEEDEVINFAKKNLNKVIDNINCSSRIFLLSSKQALVYRRLENGESLPIKSLQWKPSSLTDTGFPLFEENLAKFLVEEKGTYKLKRYQKIAISISESLIKDLNIRLEITKHCTDDIQEKLEKMKTILETTQIDTKQAVQLMKINMRQHADEIRNICLSNNMIIRKIINNIVDNYDGEWDTNLRSDINRSIYKEKEKLINKIQSVESNIMQKESIAMENYLKKIWSDIDMNYQINFSLPRIDYYNKDFDIEASISDSNETKDFINATAIGVVIGGVIGGAALLPVLALAGGLAYMSNLLDNNNSNQENKKMY